MEDRPGERAGEVARPVTRRQVLKQFAGGLLALALPAAAVLAQGPLTFNTGVDDSGAVLDNYAVDAHFTLFASADPRFPGPDTVVVDNTLFPIATGNWIASSPTSKWIAPQGDQDYLIDANNGNALGDYTYRTTFDLTGYEPELVRLVGQWTVDSAGIDILINGASTGSSISTNLPVSGEWWHPFFVSTGFVQGTNTLDFIVERVPWGNSTYLPTGLRAEFIITNLPPPQLRILAASPLVLVWWPTNTPAFALETSARLGTNENWSLFRGPITVVSDQNVVVAAPSGPSMFLRLRRR